MLTSPSAMSAVLIRAMETRWRDAKDGERQYKHCQEFLAYCGGLANARAIAHRAKNYTAHLVGLGLSGASVNRRLSSLNVLLATAAEMLIIPPAEVPKLRRQREAEGRVRTLTALELAQIREHLAYRSHSLFEFLLNTGMRLSEALSLTGNAIRTNGCAGWSAHLADTKSGRPRTVPLNKAACESIVPIPSGPIFKVAMRTFQSDFSDAVHEAGLKDPSEVVVHTLRHTCATNLLSKGVPLAHVSRLLGHSSIQTTMRYAHSSIEDLQAAVDKL